MFQREPKGEQMTRLAIVAAGLLLAGGSAWAQQPSGNGRQKATAQTTTADWKKHLTAIEAYTDSALNQSRVIYESTVLLQGTVDRVLWKEGATRVTQDLEKAHLHLHQAELGLAAAGKRADDTRRKL